MSAITLKTAGAAMVANAVALAAASSASLTSAQCIAIGNMLTIMDEQKGLSVPTRQLTATDLAELTSS